MDEKSNWRAGKLVLLVNRDKSLCLTGCQPVQTADAKPRVKPKKPRRIYANTSLETTL